MQGHFHLRFLFQIREKLDNILCYICSVSPRERGVMFHFGFVLSVAQAKRFNFLIFCYYFN